MKNARKILALALALCMCLCLFTACGKSSGGGGESGSGGNDSDTLVVGYSPFNSKFSPFFAETVYDQDAQLMTQITLLNSDRQGAPVLMGIDGETREYNGTDYTYYGPANCEIVENEDGTVDYNFTLRDDIVFSDGEPLTVDDVIFSMYVLCDPTYDGASTLYAVPIEGIDKYRAGMDTLFNLITAAGRDNTDFSLWSEEQQKALWEDIDQAGVKFVTEIKDYCVANGLNEESDPVSKWAPNWGYEVADDATEADLFNAMVEAYDGNISEMSDTETAGSSIFDLMEHYEDYQNGVSTGETADSISGIKKTGDNTFTVTLSQVDATAIYQLAVYIAPLHYYGDKDAYDYDNNKFGFPKGDLSSVRAKTTQPMGAGPYKFIKFENGTIRFEANENYMLGAPKIKYLNFLETQETDKLNGVVTGTIDVTDPSFSADAIDAIKEANGGEVNGDKIQVDTVDNLGYGYIGINSINVSVNNEPSSDASKNLRKAFGTIFSVYRDLAIDSYYGEQASVINYPISNTSWAAPQPTDDGYSIAFSKDVNGEDIYTSGMSAEDKYQAALDAALGYFEAAGYTVSDGKVTAAPEGAKMEYEILIPGDGTGDHPSFMICSEASKALEKIGIKLIVTDLADSSELWDKLDAVQCEMWCAAWQATVDPDMYQIYYSDVKNAAKGAGTNPLGGPEQGGSNYQYCIADPELDQLIMDARMSLDQAYRKTVYKAALDIVVDWAVEIPVYQRQNAIIFSPERVNMDTVTPDITTFYKWYSEIENMEMK